MGGILVILGALVAFGAGIWLLVVIFSESVLWGIASLLVPLVGLIFVITHWRAAKRPFLIQLVGAAIAIVGVLISPDAVHRVREV